MKDQPTIQHLDELLAKPAFVRERKIDTNLNELEFGIIRTALEAKFIDWRNRRDKASQLNTSNVLDCEIAMEQINNILRKFDLETL